MKKILLFSRDPGGANTIIPLHHPLVAQGYDVVLWGKDVALSRYKEAGLPVKDIMSQLCEFSTLSIR